MPDRLSTLVDQIITESTDPADPGNPIATLRAVRNPSTRAELLYQRLKQIGELPDPEIQKFSTADPAAVRSWAQTQLKDLTAELPGFGGGLLRGAKQSLLPGISAGDPTITPSTAQTGFATGAMLGSLPWYMGLGGAAIGSGGMGAPLALGALGAKEAITDRYTRVREEELLKEGQREEAALRQSLGSQESQDPALAAREGFDAWKGPLAIGALAAGGMGGTRALVRSPLIGQATREAMTLPAIAKRTGLSAIPQAGEMALQPVALHATGSGSPEGLGATYGAYANLPGPIAAMLLGGSAAQGIAKMPRPQAIAPKPVVRPPADLSAARAIPPLGQAPMQAGPALQPAHLQAAALARALEAAANPNRITQELTTPGSGSALYSNPRRLIPPDDPSSRVEWLGTLSEDLGKQLGARGRYVVRRPGSQIPELAPYSFMLGHGQELPTGPGQKMGIPPGYRVPGKLYQDPKQAPQVTWAGKPGRAFAYELGQIGPEGRPVAPQGRVVLELDPTPDDPTPQQLIVPAKDVVGIEQLYPAPRQPKPFTPVGGDATRPTTPLDPDQAMDLFGETSEQVLETLRQMLGRRSGNPAPDPWTQGKLF